MKKYLYFILALPVFWACSEGQNEKNGLAENDIPFDASNKKLVVYTTADSTDLRLTITDTLSFRELKQPVETQVCIFADPAKRFQTYMGVGGALTDAAAETFAKLPQATQEELLNAYYDKSKGIGYTLGRTNINSCDFSSDNYTYVANDDKQLSTFDISHDLKYKIPLIKKAIEKAGGNLTMFVSPWSPPAFMKSNNNMLHGGKLKPEFYMAWAKYYGKFIKEYEKNGIPVWGLTIQNEPMATQKWESCIYTAEEERDFLKNFLGPQLSEDGLADKKIIVWDHNRDLMVQRANVIFSDKDASKYAWGMGFHWYESWSGGDKMFDNVALVHEAFPDKNLLFTEGCPESFNPAMYNRWSLGEAYGRNMIHDFNNGATGWTDWNILLDQTGGPNHAGNFCFAPVHADLNTGKLIYTNSYYYIGHISKFVHPGDRRILCSASRSQLIATAFESNVGKVSVIVMNQGNTPVVYNLCIGSFASEIKIGPHAIQTLVL